MTTPALDYEHDDKENKMGNDDDDDHAMSANPAESMSITPAFAYRRTSDDERVEQHEALLTAVLYNDLEVSSDRPDPGGRDMVYERSTSDNNDALSEMVSAHASGENMIQDLAAMIDM